MRLAIASDHAGFELKEALKEYLAEGGHKITDLGPDSADPVDYPVYGEKVARAVADGKADIGVLVCGTGLGMAIAANKVHGVRAVPVTDEQFARAARAHNDANVITLAGRHTDATTAARIVDTFLATPFEGGRHERRVGQMARIENGD